MNNIFILVIGIFAIVFLIVSSFISRYFLFKFYKDIIDEIKKMKAYYQ